MFPLNFLVLLILQYHLSLHHDVKATNNFPLVRPCGLRAGMRCNVPLGVLNGDRSHASLYKSRQDLFFIHSFSFIRIIAFKN